MDTQGTLAALCASAGPSGREQQTADLAMELLRPLVDEVGQDAFGNVVGVRRCGKAHARRVVLDAHLDEVGLVVTGAKHGFLRFRAVGGIDPRVLPDQEFTLLTQPATVAVVAVLPPHVQKAGEGDNSLPLSQLYLDAGLTQAEAEGLVGHLCGAQKPAAAAAGGASQRQSPG